MAGLLLRCAWVCLVYKLGHAMTASILSGMHEPPARCACRGANGWGRARRDSSLAELGITEEEFEEYSAATAKRPRRAAGDSAGGDLAGGASLAMGMDVEQPAPAQPRPLPGAALLVAPSILLFGRRSAEPLTALPACCIL